MRQRTRSAAPLPSRRQCRRRQVWVFSTAEARVHQAAPLVAGGVMFVTSPNNQVIAIDVKTGNLLWRYRRPRTPAMAVPHETNGGAIWVFALEYGA